MENSNYSFNSKNICEWCQKHGRTKIQHTHKTEKCFYGDKSGSVKFNKNNDQNYFVAFHDSGSTPRSYFKDIPNNCRKSNSFVQTANNQKIPVVGTGSVKFGKMELNDVAYVPSFTKNLVSGIQIMNQGYKQIIENGELKIFKNNDLVATGKYDLETGLIKMDSEIQQNSNYCRTEQNLNYKNIHSRLGHPGNTLLQKTLDATNGLKIVGKIQNDDCEICLKTKTKKLNIRKKGSIPNDYLDVIESDTQGPFPIIATDGTRNNVKFVDKKSRFTKMFTIPNREASTILNYFKQFKSRMENITGKNIKNIRTDQGTEYKGEFLEYLTENGIIKQTGIAYEHNHPGQAERVHQTIMTMGRAILKESKLPQNFYNEAQLTAVYLHNRQIHGNDSKTPFEHIYGKRPNLSHLQPFGCVCYSHIPIERRSKLDDTTEKCRLIGYGDDDSAEEFKGYKLIVESNLQIIYNKNVTFPEIPIFEEIPNLQNTEIEEDNLFGDPNFTLEEIEENENLESENFGNNFLELENSESQNSEVESQDSENSENENILEIDSETIKIEIDFSTFYVLESSIGEIEFSHK